MRESVTAAFSEPEHFGAALRAEGYQNFIVRTPRGFRARLTQVSLNEIRLTAAEEQVPRVAFVAVPLVSYWRLADIIQDLCYVRYWDKSRPPK